MSAKVEHSYKELPLNVNVVREAQAEKKTLSQKLEELDPTSRYASTDSESKLDAYERQLKRFNIRLKSDLKSWRGASFLEEFINPIDERGERIAVAGDGSERFFASNQPQSWVLYPEFINRVMRIIPLPEDVLSEIVGMVTPVDTNLWKGIYLKDNIQTAPGQAQRQMVRVGEGAEIPPMTIATYENGVQLNKYGLSLRGSYETYRRLRVDLFSLMLSRVSQQQKLDLATWALNILVNGDGNSNSATNYNISTFDAAAPSFTSTSQTDLVTGATSTISRGLTYGAWLKFRASLYPLHITTVVGRLNELIQVLQLQMPNIDPMTFLALLQPGKGPVEGGSLSMTTNVFGSNIRLVYHPWAPGGVLIGLDKRYAIEQLVENNSALTETDKDIKTQMNEIVISQVVGFDKFLQNASVTLTFA